MAVQNVATIPPYGRATESPAGTRPEGLGEIAFTPAYARDDRIRMKVRATCEPGFTVALSDTGSDSWTAIVEVQVRPGEGPRVAEVEAVLQARDVPDRVQVMAFADSRMFAFLT